MIKNVKAEVTEKKGKYAFFRDLILHFRYEASEMNSPRFS